MTGARLLTAHRPYLPEGKKFLRNVLFAGVNPADEKEGKRKNMPGCTGTGPDHAFLSSCFLISRILVSISSEYGVTR
jgi:hypothetical protein